jgi:hypothetical protein
VIRSLAAALLVACLPDISDSLDPGPPPRAETTVVVVTEPPVRESGDTATEEPLPVAEITVDATAYDVWSGLDLDAFDPLADPDGAAWDLRFRRFEVALNGGVSGGGGVEVTWLAGVPFDQVLDVPVDATWVTDEPDADGDGTPEHALIDWYDYDEDTHELSPADRTYVVRTTEGVPYRLAFEAYYDASGTPARIRIRTGPLSH